MQNFDFVLVVEDVGSLFGQIETADPLIIERAVQEFVQDRYSLRGSQSLVNSAKQVQTVHRRSGVLCQRPQGRQCGNNRTVVEHVVACGQQESCGIGNRPVEFRLAYAALLERTNRSQSILCVQCGIPEYRDHIASVAAVHAALGRDLQPPLARSAKFGRIGILVYGHVLHARRGQIERAGHNSIHDNLRAAGAVAEY